jgi:Sec-independent protein translocase protein TatA
MWPASIGHAGHGGSTPSSSSGVTTNLGFIIPLAILGVALGAVAVYAQMGKIGISLIVGSLAALGLTLVTIRYANLIATAGIVGAGLVAVWGLAVKYKGLASAASAAASAFKDVVKGVQAVKEKVVSKTSLNKEDVNKVLADNQTSQTQEMVKAAKAELSL